MNYGLPYMGSKSRICDWLMANLPSAETFVDLFAGGCAVTHAALLSGRYKRVIANDIQGEYPKLFFRLATEGLKPEEWYPISREEYELRKSSDPLIRLVWSFGNNDKKGYLYAKEIEPMKTLSHRLIVTESRSERYDIFRQLFGLIGKYSQSDGDRILSFERLERLQELEALVRLNTLDRLKVFGCDYKDVQIPENSIVYADPPYIGTEKYGSGEFYHDEFYKWLRNVQYPVYVSEYTMPDDFVCVAETELVSTLSATNNSKRVTERLFLHERFAERNETMNLFELI